MNIISLVCAIARVQGIYMNEQYKRELAYKNTRMYKYEKYKRALTSLLRKNSRGIKGVWKNGAPNGRLEVHATAALLWAAKGEIHTLRAPGPGHENPGESVKLPRRV